MLMLAQHRQPAFVNGKGAYHSLIHHSIHTAVIQVSTRMSSTAESEELPVIQDYKHLCSREHLVQTQSTPSRDEKSVLLSLQTKARLICLEYINHSNLTLNRSNTELSSQTPLTRNPLQTQVTMKQFLPKYKLKFEWQQ